MRHASCNCNRRQFLGAALPACVMGCLAVTALPAAAWKQQASGSQAKSSQPPGHVFDAEAPRTPTYRDLIKLKFAGVIPLILRLEQTIGREKTIEVLRSSSDAQSRSFGRAAAAQSGANDMAALRAVLTQGPATHLWVFQIIESTERVFELRVSECLFATILRDGRVDGELGHAAQCYGDHGFAEAFNPKLRLVRTKTIMQGHGACNHHFTLTA
jgi:hypothetical protein